MIGSGLGRTRLAHRVVLPAGVMLLLVAALYVAATWDHPAGRLAEDVRTAAVALQVVDPGGEGVDLLLRDVALQRGYERAWVIDGSGRIERSSHPGEAGSELDAPWWDVLAAAAGSTVAERMTWGNRILFIGAHRSAVTGRWSVVLADGTGILRGRLTSALIAFGLALIVWLVTAVSFHVQAARRLGKPLAEIDLMAERMLAGESAQQGRLDRIAARADETLARLAQALGVIWRRHDDLSAKLAEQQARYYATLHLARELVCMCSFDGTILEVNRSFCDKLGRSRDALLGHAMEILSTQLPVQLLMELGERSAREKRTFERLLLAFSALDGSDLRVVASVQAVPFEGEPAYVVVADDRTGEHVLNGRLSELLSQFEVTPCEAESVEFDDEGDDAQVPAAHDDRDDVDTGRHDAFTASVRSVEEEENAAATSDQLLDVRLDDAAKPGEAEVKRPLAPEIDAEGRKEDSRPGN